MKKSTISPSLASKSHRLLDEDEDSVTGEEDESEETLKLQLAAIETKLKLKKLQKNKSKSQANSSDAENQDKPQSKSAHQPRPISRTHRGRDQPQEPGLTSDRVKVPLSPTKRPIPQSKARSPHRVLLGIDKGARAEDVSLRRAPSGREHRLYFDQNGRDGRESRFSSMRSRSTVSSETSNIPRVKSFSERMAEVRSDDAARQGRRERAENNRSSSFKLNATEMDGYRAAAEEIRSRNRSRSPMKRTEQHDFGRDEVLRSYGNGKSSNGLRRSNTLPSAQSGNRTHDRDQSSRQRSQSPSKPSRNSTPSDTIQATSPSEDTSHYDPFSETRLSTRILPHTFIERTISSSIAPIRLPFLLKTVKAPDFELPDNIAGDFAIFGTIASVSRPYDHKDHHKPMTAADDNKKLELKWQQIKNNNNGNASAKRFMVLTLTDLKWTVDLFLFSSALPRYHRLSPGTVIAVLNPGIMPPKPGKIDTGAFSLTLHSGDDTILEIGTSTDMGFCKALRKDGRECGSWVDTRKTEFCEFHIDLKIQRTQAGRMGVNTGSNAFGPGGGRFGSIGRRGRDGENDGDGKSNSRGGGGGGRGGGIRRDFATGERYFISQPLQAPPASSRPTTSASSYSRPRDAAATMLDAELDDPFLNLAEGTISRDSMVSRGERMRKRLVAQAQEREIAVKLGRFAEEGARDTGAEYLRRREENSLKSQGGGEEGRGGERRKMTKEDILEGHGWGGWGRENGRDNGKGNGNGKRGADDVNLSPVRATAREVKKTRFVTERGIKVAGRESGVGVGNHDCGHGHGHGHGGKDGNEKEDDEDFLDII